jgi:hypothetical protein
VKKTYYNEKEARECMSIVLGALKYMHHRNITSSLRTFCSKSGQRHQCEAGGLRLRDRGTRKLTHLAS